MRVGAVALSLSASVLVWGCATKPAEPVPWQQVRAEIPPGMARLYVAVRPAVGAAGAQLYINDQWAAWMREGGCSTYVLAPGRIELSTKSTDPLNRLLWGKSDLILLLAPGEIAFVDIRTAFFGGQELQRVDAAQGEELIRKIGNCATLPFDITTPAEAVSVIEAAHKTIEREYVDPVESGSLLDACLEALPTDAVDAARASAPGDRSSKTVEAALSKVPSADLQKATDACVTAMAKKLDSQSRYIKRSEARRMRRYGGESEMGGVGLEFASAPEGARIVGVVDGSPAASAGLTRGDLLVAVGDADLRGRPLEDIIEALQGAPASAVSLAILRAGRSEPARFDLKREIVQPVTVYGRLIEHDIAYLQLVYLITSTPDQLVAAVSELRKENDRALGGLIVDLRWCPGGLLMTAGAVATAFVPPGSTIAQAKGRTSKASSNLRAEPKDYASVMHASFKSLPDELKSAPIVVLVGPKTGAGGEIVAAALHHLRHAELVGASTAGNNRVRVFFELPRDAGLMLTIAHIYLADGNPLKPSGLQPDVVVDPPSLPKDGLPPPTVSTLKDLDAGSDPDMRHALSILKDRRTAFDR